MTHALTEPAWSACNAAAKRAGLEPALVRAVCWIESRGDPSAVSPVGARGLMQLMPDTATAIGCKNIFDAFDNAAGGARYLGQLIVRFGDIDSALHAYNWGPGNVDRVRRGVHTLPESVAKYARDVGDRWEVERTYKLPFIPALPKGPRTSLPSRSSSISSSDGKSRGGPIFNSRKKDPS